MTIKEARKILGKAGIGMSDSEVEREITIATLLKDIFFKLVSEKKHRNHKQPVNLLNFVQ